jgi:WD40 repeat protein
LVVKGLPSSDWDDCLTRIDFDKGNPVALAHGVRLFAVGLSSGIIKLYDTLSVQCVRELIHPERIRLLTFNANDEMIVSCGTKKVTAWSTRTGQAIISSPCESLVLAATFLSSDELLLASQASQLTRWYLHILLAP